ncbi:MAG: DUF6134 family protein [Pseudomonadales bacterium]|nr:DUF6134 family protein [Pseudomonadales bacterium]
MNAWLRKFVFIYATVLVFSQVSIANTGSGKGSSESWNFRVMLDDTPIGYHKVNIDRIDNTKMVHTRANFDVRILFIPVYSYTHETRERWEDNCLVDISSTTDDNGEKYFISSLNKEERLAVETLNGTASLGGCVRTFAYWDVDLLKSRRLLNTQTGEYERVSVRDMGTGMLTINNEQIEARHFRLVAEELTIELWYTKDMYWLALESVTASGAVLRYLPEKIPQLALDRRS